MESAAAVPRRLSLKEQQRRLREDVILQAVNSLLAEKGFDLMTVDEVAALVGVSKASLYKHFESKEALAAAAMARLLDRVLDVIVEQRDAMAPVDKLKAVMNWAVTERLRGQMPSLPSAHSTLRDALARNRTYVDRLIDVSDRLGAWIELAQQRSELDASLPPEVVLYTLCARACDPVSEYLKASGKYRDDEIVALITKTCFDGLAARRS